MLRIKFKFLKRATAVWSAAFVVFSMASTAADNGGLLDLVGAGTVSTDAREFAASLSPDGGHMYFNRSSDSQSWHIWASERGEDGWLPASTLWFSDEHYSDVDPFVSRSGDRLYFSSDRPVPGTKSEDPTPDTNTWYAPRTKDGWGQPVYAGRAVNSSFSETFVSESAEGDLVYTRFGEGSGRDRPAYLMIARRDGAGFAPPRQITTAPDGLRVSNPAISADGRMIIAAGTQKDAPKLYYSRRLSADNWSPFKPLPAPINVLGGVQFAPYISNDGKWLYFSSEREAPAEAGSGDIYRVPLDQVVSD